MVVEGKVELRQLTEVMIGQAKTECENWQNVGHGEPRLCTAET